MAVLVIVLSVLMLMNSVYMLLFLAPILISLFGSSAAIWVFLQLIANLTSLIGSSVFACGYDTTEFRCCGIHGANTVIPHFNQLLRGKQEEV